MLLAIDNVFSVNVNNNTTNTLGGVDDNVGVFNHGKVVQRLALLGLVQHTRVNGVRNGVVNELGQNQTIAALIKNLKGVGGEGESVTNVRVTGKNTVNVPRELRCALHR